MFTLKIKTDNAAFEDDPGLEIARILKLWAERIERGINLELPLSNHPVYDLNGNKVGTIDWK